MMHMRGVLSAESIPQQHLGSGRECGSHSSVGGAAKRMPGSGVLSHSALVSGAGDAASQVSGAGAGPCVYAVCTSARLTCARASKRLLATEVDISTAPSRRASSSSMSGSTEK